MLQYDLLFHPTKSVFTFLILYLFVSIFNLHSVMFLGKRGHGSHLIS